MQARKTPKRRAGAASPATPARRAPNSGEPPRRRRLEPAQRRAQLLDAAMRVFAERGLAKATHAEIADACGVAVGTAFLYFPTREALVAGVLDEVERVAMDAVERCYGAGAVAPEAIRRHIAETLDQVDANPAYGLIWLDWSTAVRDEIWPRYMAFQSRVVSRIGDAIAAGQRSKAVPARVDPDLSAKLIVSSTQMLAQMHFTAEPRARIEAFGNAVVDMALGLAPEPLY